MIPKPGSDAAREQGCTCPVLDNQEMPGSLCWMSLSCPIHGRVDVIKDWKQWKEVKE